MERPLASVIVPVYNGEPYLGAALQSIFEQDYHPFEVIVVDDGSVDGSADVAKSFGGVRYIYQTNQGNAAALNAGIEAARGDFIAFLDADDLWASNKLSIEIDYLLKRPNIGFVIASMQNFLEPGTRRPPRLTRDLLLTDYAALSVGTLVARKAVFERIGNFNTAHRYAKDVDWFIRAKEAGIHMAILPQTLLYRRLHGSNSSYQTEARTSDLLRVVKSGIDRKRGNSSTR
jgi:glycosyltransferase involved in cell wall biosynthesis